MIEEMAYSVAISVIFKLPPDEVFRALTFLDDFPLWNTALVSISKSGYMKENMLIEIESNVMGKQVKSNMEVVRLDQDKEIELINNSGAISYRVLYRLMPDQENSTEVVCMMQLDLKSFALDLARPVVESIAEQRLRNNLELLRTLIRG